jgi:hypothetical protein
MKAQLQRSSLEPHLVQRRQPHRAVQFPSPQLDIGQRVKKALAAFSVAVALSCSGVFSNHVVLETSVAYTTYCSN